MIVRTVLFMAPVVVMAKVILMVMATVMVTVVVKVMIMLVHPGDRCTHEQSEEPRRAHRQRPCGETVFIIHVWITVFDSAQGKQQGWT
jgi:hypothetical protein